MEKSSETVFKCAGKALAVILMQAVLALNLTVVCPDGSFYKVINIECLSPAVAVEDSIFINDFQGLYSDFMPLEQSAKEPEQIPQIRTGKWEAVRRFLGSLLSIVYPININKINVLASMLYVLIVPVSGMVSEINMISGMYAYNDGRTYITNETLGHIVYKPKENVLSDSIRDYEVLEDLSDAILEFMMNMNGNADGSNTRSSAEAIRNIEMNRKTVFSRRRKRSVENNEDKSSNPVFSKEPLISKMAVTEGRTLGALEIMLPGANMILLISQAI